MPQPDDNIVLNRFGSKFPIRHFLYFLNNRSSFGEILEPFFSKKHDAVAVACFFGWARIRMHPFDSWTAFSSNAKVVILNIIKCTTTQKHKSLYVYFKWGNWTLRTFFFFSFSDSPIFSVSLKLKTAYMQDEKNDLHLLISFFGAMNIVVNSYLHKSIRS